MCKVQNILCSLQASNKEDKVILDLQTVYFSSFPPPYSCCHHQIFTVSLWGRAMNDKTEINQVIQPTWKRLICLWPLSTSTKQILALQCGDCWVNILSRRSWFVLITEAYGTVCTTARWLCGILHLALVTVVFHRDANHQACAGGMIKCHTAPSVLGLSLWINLSHPQAGEAWSLQPRSEQPELHRATAPPTGHNTEDNNNQVSVQTVVLHHPKLSHYAH